MGDNSMLIALKVAGNKSVTVKGANSAGGQLFLRSSQPLEDVITAGLTLLSAGARHVSACVAPYHDMALTVYVPSRYSFRSKEVTSVSEHGPLMSIATHVVEPSDGSLLWYETTPDFCVDDTGQYGVREQHTHGRRSRTKPQKRREAKKSGGRKAVYTDASLRTDGAALGWVAVDNSRATVTHVKRGAVEENPTRMEMEAVVCSVEQNKGELWVYSDCLQAVEGLNGQNSICRKTVWGKDLREKFLAVSRGKKVNLLWVPGHQQRNRRTHRTQHITMNRYIDTMVRTASLHTH